MSDTTLTFDSLKSRFSSRVGFSPTVEELVVTEVTTLRVEGEMATVDETTILTTDKGYICIWSPNNGNAMQQSMYEQRAKTLAPIVDQVFLAGNLQTQAASIKHPGCEEFLFSGHLDVPVKLMVEIKDKAPFWPAGIDMPCLPVSRDMPCLFVTKLTLVD